LQHLKFRTTVSDVDLPTKAVVLARGLGTRMRAARDTARIEPDQAAVADTGVNRFAAASPMVTAGFRWQPEMCPMA